MSINSKTLFCAGVLMGMLTTLLLFLFLRIEIAQINLPKIVTSYAAMAARGNKATAEINQDFKFKFRQALAKISPRTVLINKGQVISNHELYDYTDKILSNMGVKSADN